MAKYSDVCYAAALDARPPGNLPKKHERQRVDIDGVITDVPIGRFLSNLRSRGRREAFEPVLTQAFGRHNVTPIQIPDGTWTIPQTGQHIVWKDAHYAAALDARPPGDLPKQGDTEGVNVNGVVADVPVGQFLSTLRSRGRREAFEPVLTQAFGRHNVTPIQIPDGTWTIPQTGQHIVWKDAHYAAALDARPPGDLPKQGDTEGVDIDGVAADVPIGRFLSRLRTVGRREAFEPVLTQAFGRHNVTPIQIPDGTWTIPQTGHRIVWKDAHYAAALNARTPGDLPKNDDTEEVNIDGVIADVPIGRFLSTLRSTGRRGAFEPVLTQAFGRHNVTPIQIPDGTWKIPQTGHRIVWKDAHYAAALDARPLGDLPKQGDTEGVDIDGVAADVPIGRFLGTLRTVGRRGAFEPVLTQAFGRHGWSPVQVGDMWKISGAVADDGRVFHGDQQYPQNPVASYSHHNSGGYPASGTSSQAAVLPQIMDGVSVTASAASFSFPVSSSALNTSAMQESTARVDGPSGGNGYPANPVTAGQYLPSNHGYQHAGPSSYRHAETPSKRGRKR
ncbi:hypothetical protein [Streptomyces sp. NBC_01462]|uniref:hypothetical protein n=1 Tax=Streptomyces sp. NBC_01462 TaxID=2903876 RepID=UPI002E309306|nr:hypothetical protein [Streptomyces sp. NBC_01462]